MAFFLFILLCIPLAFTLVGLSVSAPAYKGPQSDHFNGKKFVNPGGVEVPGLNKVFKWMLNRKRTPWKENVHAPPGKRPLDHYNDGIRITFVNHSTFLIQVDGLNVLTDPVWAKRASPFSWAGPKRMCPPGIRFEDLPRIHLILLSHNHYDHLDLQTMRLLFGAHHPRIVTPLGVKKFLDNESITGATDVDWWTVLPVNERVSIQCVPAQHFSGRGMLDRNKTLWCGYVINTTRGKIYFAGDTGYNPAIFKEIRQKCSPVRVAMIPIGAYKPQWFMAPVHTSPEEAVLIHREIGSQFSIGSHFGTFPLADEGLEEPLRDLASALQANGISTESFVALKEGEFTVCE
jgi:L-ascorbate metabolism protein UlaG (beta-lactamase superfamily)